MNILVCPTAFKESLGAAEAARALARGVRDAQPAWTTVEIPLSDGGPGLLDALAAVGGERPAAGNREPPADVRAAPEPATTRIERVPITGPLGDPAEGRILWLPGGEAVIESADGCGLHLLGERRAPLEAHTRGVGELLARALEGGAAAVRVGLGGSASTDGGTGLARAFGWRFLDADGRELPPGGGALTRLARIEPGRRPGPAGERAAAAGAGAAGSRGPGGPPAGAEIVALSDVTTPLIGMRGAARTFGPQKGADREQVGRLVEGLERLAERIAGDLGPEAAELTGIPGSGAAGGLGAGLAVFLGARIVPGSAWVLERVDFGAKLARADAVVTGEGAWDRSSEVGKITSEVLRRAAERGVPAALVCGRLASDTPDGVVGLDGGGAWLDAEGLRALAGRAADELAARAAARPDPGTPGSSP